jgi:hypothetical protein
MLFAALRLIISGVITKTAAGDLPTVLGWRETVVTSSHVDFAELLDVHVQEAVDVVGRLGRRGSVVGIQRLGVGIRRLDVDGRSGVCAGRP